MSSRTDKDELEDTSSFASNDKIPGTSEDSDNRAGSPNEKHLTSSDGQNPHLSSYYEDFDTESLSSEARSADVGPQTQPVALKTEGSSRTRSSVRDIYGDAQPDVISLRRTQSRKTIMKTLSSRLEKTDTYKDVPDISVPTTNFGKEFDDVDPELVTWDENDPEFPRNWSLKAKSMQTLIVALYTLISPMSSSVSSPASAEIAKDFGITNKSVQALTVSIMILAFAIGPLVIAPLSESDRIGRKPIMNLSIWIIFCFNLGCGFTKNTYSLCILRFLGGLGGCAALNVGAGTLADLFDDKTRNTAMAFYSICPSLGPVVSPIISGFVVQNLNWRWCFWILSIFNFAVAVVGTIFFKETYSPKLLHDRAVRLRKETGNENLHTIFDLANDVPRWLVIRYTMLRPVKLLTYHPMVIGLGSFMAFAYGFMYLMLVTFPKVFQGSYGFSVEISGLMFIPMGIGYILGTIVFTLLVQHFYDKLTAQNGGVPKPEYRLPCLVVSGVGLPMGLVIYGWSVQYKTHWMVPALGSGIFAFSFIAVFQTIQNYLIDMNPRFSASSVAAAAMFRSLFGFSFPLFATAMYDRLGYGWGNTMCAFIGLALGIPFPLFCLKYGERLRHWADRRMAKQQAAFDEKVFKVKNAA
ncbi:spermidine exporter, MDR-type pump [Yamadazyma tenuis ATCC 10573]|uniref:Spermidine exporter, MDR-type pump n=1 Tax=Candida tenuis (strain ATCC 10573 / BCRC 21748 / CBS 615 / JCM 9827 / NBRC 10315 / NRRL Y-1498 / VKM Y-70) TaxID=590646 RepID=G3BAD7_CANTC|nr:spermidine exporter, MDR-type pump [Yamadazyma tenuis ATCC 10573]EGV62037.1 spermidine exporter, MDR-type pump [Yamadazyma tenuis ATCC 10573]